MDQATPAPAGAGILPASECATARPLQLLWRARELPLAQPPLPLGDGLYVQMAQPAGGEAEELHVGAGYPRPRPRQESAHSCFRGSTVDRGWLKAPACTPGAG